MKKKYIIEIDEIINCRECDCSSQNYLGDRLCPFLGDEVWGDEIDKNCPLTELKPNKLNWELSDITGLYSALNGKYTISPSRIYEKEPIFYSCFFLGIHLENKDTINDAKQFCQDHNDYLFLEMVGGKK